MTIYERMILTFNNTNNYIVFINVTKIEVVVKEENIDFIDIGFTLCLIIYIDLWMAVTCTIEKVSAL